MAEDQLKIFMNQARENIHLLERHIMHAKLQLNLFAEYRNEITRDNLIETLEIAQDLNKWIIDNAKELKMCQEMPK